MKRMKYFAIALLSLLAIACTEEQVDSVQMKSSEMTFTVEGGETSLSFSANALWEIRCDADWLTFDPKSGDAGDVKVKMTVAANQSYDERKADVTIAAGTFTNVIKVLQKGVDEFTATIPYKIDANAQKITFDIKSNVGVSYTIGEKSKSWIREAKTKAAPAESQLIFDIAANTNLTAREGQIVVIAGDASYCLAIQQSGVAEEMISASAEYLANSMDIYDGEYTKTQEYYILLKGEKKNVGLAINANPESKEDPFAGIPAGTYAIDAGANHAANTFSIKNAEGTERCYTAIFEGEKETNISDGEINITKEGDEYEINAILIDLSGRQNNFFFKGKIGEIADKSYDGNIEGAFYKGQYDTYYASQSNAWVLTMHTNKAQKEGDPHMGYLNVTFYGPAGEVSKTEYPTGTFTFKNPAIKESKYANGNMDAQPGTFTMFGSDPEGNDCEVVSGTIKIAKDEKGLYSFDYDLKMKHVVIVRDDDWNEISRTEKDFDFKAVFSEKVLKVVPGDFLPPLPDADYTFKSVLGNSYSALWLGNVWNIENCNAFIISFGSVDANFNVQLCLNLQGNWIFEKNFRNRFCITPLPNQKCTFSKTPGANTMLPVIYGSQPYSWVRNSYTGTQLEPCGGTVTISKDAVTFDLEATDGTKTYKFTGKIPSTLQMSQDWSARAKNIRLPE